MMYCEIEALYLLFSILYCIFPPLTPHPRCPPYWRPSCPWSTTGTSRDREEGRKLIIEVSLVLCPMSSLTLPPQSYHWTGEGIVPAHRLWDTAGGVIIFSHYFLTNVVITGYLSYTVTRVNKVLWQLTRFKQLGAHRDNLITFYILKVRSILMFGAACYHSALTSDQSQKLELQQKRSMAIILGKDYTSFDQARSLVNLPDLKLLRESVCLKWAEKAQSNPHHSHLFPRNQSLLNTRNRCKFMEYKCKGGRFFHSAVPAMAISLNRSQNQPASEPGTISITTNNGSVIIVWYV